MRIERIFVISVALALAATLASAQEDPRPEIKSMGPRDGARPPAPVVLKASAVLEPRSGSQVKGSATFTAMEDGTVRLDMQVDGLTPGLHAFHLHEKGDCSAADASSAGPHWNPTGEKHGKWGGKQFHHGDVGNLEADGQGHAVLSFSTNLWTIGGKPESDILGKSLIVHDKADDFETQPTGNAGGRVACGLVVLKR